MTKAQSNKLFRNGIIIGLLLFLGWYLFFKKKDVSTGSGANGNTDTGDNNTDNIDDGHVPCNANHIDGQPSDHCPQPWEPYDNADNGSQDMQIGSNGSFVKM